MSKLNELNSYIAQAQRRLRLGAWARGSVIFTGTALLVTVLLVLVLNYFAFPHRGMISARIALLVALAAAAAFGMIFPVRRLSMARTVSKVEATNPELEQRLTTFQQVEQDVNGPFLELLAADTLQRTQYAAPSSLVPDNRILALCGAAFACMAVLMWMIAAGPGYIGYGASLLWTGAKKNAQPFYSISVTPGNALVRRNSDQLVSVRISGMQPERVQLFAHYHSAKGWEAAAMQMRPQANGDAKYDFVLAGLPEDVDYYAAAGPLASPHYTLRVADLPSVKEIRVSYRYPAWTGMKPLTEEHSGDLRAIEGTDADVEIEMDKPLKSGQLLLDGGQPIQLSGGQGNRYRGSIHMERDGAYHVAAIDSGQLVRLSEDYFIATDKAQPPEVSISRPHGDYRAIPIEEVTVGVDAADQFALRDMQLHYSVNGGAERVVNLLNSPGAKESQGSHTLPLEDFKLVPGDLVSLYATARDGHAEARTDISFIQVEPFEREFSQSQQNGGSGGGSGGGQNNQTEISKREKELIAATWKQMNDKATTAKDAAVQGQFLSEAQQKLRDQVQALSARIESRDLSAATEEFSSFDRDMQTAAEAMAPSAQKLQATRWADALPLEQKALQALLRAEATFRKIEVAFGQSGGGSGGGNAGRDLASLFDLELDTEKNQYETGQTASPAQQHEKEVEDALAKLDALARRQQEQAQQQPNPQQAFEQRWQQEMLRREAEELQRQMEQLAKSGQQQGSPGASSASSSNNRQTNSASRQGSSSANGLQSGQPEANQTDARIQQALRRLQDATEAMKRGTGSQQNQDAARQAADQLRQAANLLAGSHQQLATNKLDSMAQQAAKLRDEERGQAQQIDKLAAQPGDGSPTDLTGMMDRLHARDRLAQERQQLSDDLSHLSRDMRESALAMAPHERDAAKQLRDALTEMDNSDLDNRVQRSADWLRRGINPNSNGTEDQIAQGLGKLQQQLEKASETAGRAQPDQGPSSSHDEAATLNAIERLRGQVDSLSRANRGQKAGQPGGRGQPGGAEQARNGTDQPGAAQGSPNATANQPSGRSGASGISTRDLSRGGSPAAGDLGGQRDSTRDDGANTAADSTVWGNINTGNNTYGPPGQRAAPGASPDNPADAERAFQQGMLNELRSMVKGDPQASQEAEALAREMQRLDPRRFPGNPEIVEQMHRELLGAIDRLELEVEHNAGGGLQSRAGKSDSVPAGYQDAVAEYFRTLSKRP